MILFNASTVAERWKKSYLNEHTGIWLYPDHGASFPAIVAANGDKSKIEAVIGNTSWTIFTCDECGTPDLTVGVELNNGDNSTAVICLECLQKAVALASKATPNVPHTDNL